MTESASHLDSVYPTLPSTLPTPNTQSNGSLSRRPSQVTEVIEKVNTRLRRLFYGRRRSAEDEHPPLDPTVARRSSISDNTSRPSEDQYAQCSSKDLAGMGLADLPNVSEYFDVNGEVGPSCFYSTTDWDTFQATLRAQRRNNMQAQWKTDLQYDEDSDLEQLDKHWQYDSRAQRYEERERKDSQFSFSDFLKPQRSSKVDKGKIRMVYDGEDGFLSQNQPLLSPYQDASSDTAGPSTVRTGVLVHAPSDESQIVSSEESVACGHQVAIGPLQSSAPGLPEDYNGPRRRSELAARKVSVRLVPLTPFCPRDEQRSSTSSSVSSFDSPAPAAKPSRTPYHLTQNVVSTPATNASEPGANGHSEPISIPSPYHISRGLSAVPVGSAQPIDDSPTFPPPLVSSTTNLLSHEYSPDTTPSSPSLQPTLVPSPEAMQSLLLGPPQRALLQRSVSSDSRMFHVPLERLSTPAPTHPILPYHGPSTVDKKGDLVRGLEDEPDFSITRPAPPSPLISASPPMADVPSPVRRRTGSLEGSEDLRAVYIEQGKASMMNRHPRRRSPRKSLQGKLWWDESPPKVYL
ncbi:hypothetical protein AA0113_g6079 [Alternaria arborescens]|uniref:Uncharacterized protein n=1 Tax=Alternaria arborescens TaxID=156630 RepID=A0A4Q4S0M6_9PLEO|nr:hypothetical protein AA0113_g6079 [Alternaria arborescens]